MWARPQKGAHFGLPFAPRENAPGTTKRAKKPFLWASIRARYGPKGPSLSVKNREKSRFLTSIQLAVIWLRAKYQQIWPNFSKFWPNFSKIWPKFTVKSALRPESGAKTAQSAVLAPAHPAMRIYRVFEAIYHMKTVKFYEFYRFFSVYLARAVCPAGV